MAKRKTSTSSIAAEPTVVYARRRPVPMRRSEHELADEVTKPMPKKQVRASLGSGLLSAAMLGVVLNIASEKLRERLAGPGDLAPAEAERIVLAEELMHRGMDAFGAREVFMAWLSDESPGLGGKRPIDLVRSITGMRLVMDELLAIEHGLPI
jgi:putative toxin-antitoxin system antitoxin component (TIGR02293 family)